MVLVEANRGLAKSQFPPIGGLSPDPIDGMGVLYDYFSSAWPVDAMSILFFI